MSLRHLLFVGFLSIVAMPFLLTRLCSEASAADFSTPILQMDGSPFTEADGKTPANVTLGIVSENALLAAYPDEANLAGAEKVKRFALANKIHGQKEVMLNADEVTLLKNLIGKGYNALITGRAWQLLDPASVPK